MYFLIQVDGWKAIAHAITYTQGCTKLQMTTLQLSFYAISRQNMSVNLNSLSIAEEGQEEDLHYLFFVCFPLIISTMHPSSFFRDHYALICLSLVFLFLLPLSPYAFPLYLPNYIILPLYTPIKYTCSPQGAA